MRRFAVIVLLLGVAGGMVWSQPYGNRINRRTAILNGNQVRTVFGNWGVIGQPAEAGKRGAWKDDNNGYLGDVSPLVGAEVKWRDTTFRALVLSPVARPQRDPRSEEPGGKPWSFEPVDGYFAGPPNQSVAVSNNRQSWPDQWPDKLGDPADPGWRSSWNGYFGKRVSADMETYFVMDDDNFERFSDSLNNTRRIHFRPDAARPNRKGLGLEIRVRGLQWAQFLAQDNIFWLYEIKNTGTTSYDRMVFGMLVGTYVGVTSTEGAGEYNDDWSFYDVRENITYTGDYGRDTRANPRWNQKFRVGMVGYAFLESPGNPFDGIDNDGDADFSSVGVSAPTFSPARFDSTTITAGMRIVLIQDDFTRVSFLVPNDTVTVYTRGRTTLLRPGVTRVAEGNEIFRDGAYSVNSNSYDGVDNDFDGLIDENYYLHYRQIKRNPNAGQPPLIDTLRIVRYIDWSSGAGISPLSMVDERRNDLADNDGDWSRNKETGQPIFDPQGNLIDDVGRDGIQGTNDAGERDGQPTSGYTLSGFDTGLPGEANIDKTDVNESDQIGLSSFNYFTPSDDISFGDDEGLWRKLTPGFFSVPLSIVNNRPEAGQDGDFVYSSGYFPLLAGATERFSLALVYGGGKGGTIENDITDLLKNKRTVQQIYDANYQFPTPPEKPMLTAVPGDRQVTLYWDRRSELSIDPVLRINDFEGYKLYKSTDPNFSDIFTITDGSGTARGYRPIAQYDLVDSIRGYFRATGELFEAAQGYNIFLGDETGLQHSFVDRDVDNGRTYYYAIVAYDRGFDSLTIFPSENTRQITVLPTGEITTDINVVTVVPNAKGAGYVGPQSGVLLDHARKYGTGSIRYDVVDQTRVTGTSYQVTFQDTRIDGVDNNSNGLLDEADSTEWDRRTSFYFVKDNTAYTEQFQPADTLLVPFTRKNLEAASVVVTDAQGAVVPPSAYIVDAPLGAIRAATAGSLPAGTYTIAYRYYPVYRSPFIKGSPFARETKDADIFDGIQLNFTNDWSVGLSNSESVWDRSDGVAPYLVTLTPVETELGSGSTLYGFRNPADYELQFAAGIVDTSVGDPLLFVEPVPVNFRVFNRTDSTYVKFIFSELTPSPGNTGRISPFDEVVLFETRGNGSRVYSWDIIFNARPNDPADTVYDFQAGDRLVLDVSKPFRQGDLLEFRTEKPRIDAPYENRASLLDRIRVVPNPYVTASAFEPPLPPGVAGGRGQRKIDFTNLPIGSTVKIFTARGEHLVTLTHDGGIEDGTVSWNLKTKENLDIAYGIYFYAVECPLGTKTGKIAIIK